MVGPFLSTYITTYIVKKDPTPVSPACQAYQLKLLEKIYYNFKVGRN